MVITEETRAQIDAAIAKYPKKRGALLPALHLTQKQVGGHITKEAAEELAEIFEISVVQVMEVVSFYNMFYDKPTGKHRAHVCTNLPCSLRGARTLLKQLESHFGIEAGETTEDGNLTLHHEECLGACAYGPMMRIDGVEEKYFEDLDFEKAKQILEGLE